MHVFLCEAARNRGSSSNQAQPLSVDPAQCYNTPTALLIEGWSHEIRGAGTLTELPLGP